MAFLLLRLLCFLAVPSAIWIKTVECVELCELKVPSEENVAAVRGPGLHLPGKSQPGLNRIIVDGKLQDQGNDQGKQRYTIRTSIKVTK